MRFPTTSSIRGASTYGRWLEVRFAWRPTECSDIFDCTLTVDILLTDVRLLLIGLPILILALAVS